MKKRVLSALLALVMVAAMLPVTPAAVAAPIKLTPNQVKAKIDHYVQALGIGTGYTYYWNAGLRDGDDDARLQQALDRYASGSGSKADLEVGLTTAQTGGCCKGRYNPAPNDTHLYEVWVGGNRGCTSNCFNGGAQCCGFARYFQYYLFGQKSYIPATQSTNTEYYYEYRSSTPLSSIGGFQVGDHVRVNGHSFIYYGVGDRNKVIAVQINGHSSSRPCSLNFETVYSSTVNSYGGGAEYTLTALEQDYGVGRVTIQRYKNIFSCLHKANGKSTYVYHNKNTVKCSLCQDVYPTPTLSGDPVYTYMDIILAGTDKTSAPGHVGAPYKEAKVGNRFKNGQTVYVRGSFVNARGNTWYQLANGEWLSGEYLGTHVHTFNSKGFCTYCFAKKDGGQYWPIWTGPVKLKVDKAKIHFAPYGDSLRYMTYTGEITVDAKVVNGYGNEWYRISDDRWRGGWIWQDRVKTSQQGITLSTATDIWYGPGWAYHTVGSIPANAKFSYYPNEISLEDPNWRSVRYGDIVGFVPGYILDNNIISSRAVEPTYTPEGSGESLEEIVVPGDSSSSGGTTPSGGASSGTSGVFVQYPTNPTYLAKKVITDTNATLVANIQKPAGSNVTACGLRIYSSNGTLLKDHRENVTNVGASVTDFHAWYDIQSELGLTLTPGTDYMYQFYAVVDGVTYEEGRTGFTTTGSAPVAPPTETEEPKQEEVVLYNLTLDTNGAPVETQVRSIPFSTTIGVLPVPIWEGYTFDGWYTQKEGGSKVSDYSIYNVPYDRTLYAHWSPKTYKLIFNTNGGTCAEQSRAILFDTTIGELPVPVRTGYTFGGWYSKAEGGNPIRGTMRYNAPFDVTIYAHWSKETAAGAMKDVPADAWYFNAVDYVIKNGLMSGYSATQFGPNDTLNRAMVVQVLYNKEGKPALNGAKHRFSDVPSGQWFNNAVTWGSNRGIVSGFGGGVFKPEDAVTIEQVAVILHNYCGRPITGGKLDSVGSYDAWAADALRWAVSKGVLNNVPFTNATEKATRAQTAQMLANYMSK